MKFAAALFAATATLAFSTPAAAQMRALNDPVVAHPDPESLFTSDDPELHRNKQAALHIMRELLQCNQWDRAGEWLTDRYIQHNPLAASGLEGVVYYFTEIAQVRRDDDCGELTSPIVAVVAEGDLVTVLIRREIPYTDNPAESYTTTWFDTWRFVDGKADVHWDPATLPVRTPPQAAAPSPASAPEQQMADRVAIESLMWRYVRAADTLDPEAYASVFTEDGRFNNVAGREALHGMIAGMAEGQAQRRAEGTLSGNMYHVMANQTIEFVTADHARVHYYWQTMFAGNDLANPPRIAAGGRGVDDVVRVDGDWLIQSRNVVPTEG
ncbi:MAG: nuclear transport factor 2 family protein [Erythrobacter sp.]|nr:MAG: nuclear transport factor 2 family protein [Erythrobacter sp.]